MGAATFAQVLEELPEESSVDHQGPARDENAGRPLPHLVHQDPPAKQHQLPPAVVAQLGDSRRP